MCFMSQKVSLLSGFHCYCTGTLLDLLSVPETLCIHGRLSDTQALLEQLLWTQSYGWIAFGAITNVLSG